MLESSSSPSASHAMMLMAKAGTKGLSVLYYHE